MKETRREFLKKSGCALGMVTLATQMQHLGLMSVLAQKAEADSTEGGDNYKAIVLIFWSGGNDGNNIVIPNHNDATISNYSAYFNERNPSTLAIQQADLLPISVARLGGLTYGLHPNFGTVTGGINPGIHPLWAGGDLAVVTNVGTLISPMTRAQFQNNSVPKPYQLFSHSDQVAEYQTSISNTQVFTGWGGRISDRLTTGQNPNGLIPMITSIAGAQLFTAGQTTLPMAIVGAPTGLNQVLNPAGFNTTAPSVARRNAFNQLRTVDLDSNYVAAASHLTDLAINANDQLQTFQEVVTAFPNTNLGNQLKQVARLIRKRNDLNVNRQIFYCQIGGFDTHNNQPVAHANLITQFSQAARAFYEEMVLLGLNNDVTTFTLSDFGRTFNPASTGGAAVGSDHAWGNHMLVIGGSVTGGNFYGSLRPDGSGHYYPTLVKNGPDDADSGTGARGRWIPTTSVDQYANTIAKWFGLPQDATTLEAVFPNLNNFSTPALDFLP